jgi:hypothetical protein
MSYIQPKTTSNNTNITGQTINTEVIQAVQNIYENALPVQVNSTTAPWFPVTLDMSKGGVFYIPSDYAISSNFQVILTNIPTDTSKAYTVTLMYYQASNLVYANQIRASDTNGTYILGTSSTYGTPLLGNGAPTLLTSPNLVIQQFVICSIPTSAGIFSRYICTNISNNY